MAGLVDTSAEADLDATLYRGLLDYAAQHKEITDAIIEILLKNAPLALTR